MASQFYTGMLLLFFARIRFALSVVNVEIVTMGVMDLRAGAASLIYHGPAIDTAIEDLAVYRETFNVTHTYIYDKEIPDCIQMVYYCSFMLSEWYYRTKTKADLFVFISPGCNDEIYVNALLSNWNILMLTTIACDPTSRNKLISPTRVTVAVLSMPKYVRALYDLLILYQWPNVFVVLDESSLPVIYPMLNGFVSLMKGRKNTQLSIRHMNYKISPDFKPILAEFQSTSRVMIFLGNAEPLRRLMINAQLLNMTSGNYAYIALEYYKAFGRFTWNVNDQEDVLAREAYRSLLLLSFDDTDGIILPNNLLDRWANKSLARYNNPFFIGKQQAVSLQPLPGLMASYNAIINFGRILNESLVEKASIDLRSGKEIAKLFVNRALFGLNNTRLGSTDAVGEYSSTIYVTDLVQDTGLFRPVLYQNAVTWELHQLGNVDWGGPSNVPPLNEPICGYRGDKALCDRTSTFAIGVGLGATAVIVAIVLVASALIMKTFVADRDRWWFLDYALLTFDASELRSTSGNVHHIKSNNNYDTKGIHRMVRVVGGASYADKVLSQWRLPANSQSATYLKDKVWLHPCQFSETIQENLMPKTAIHFLKQIRSMNHTNINHFYGVCFSPSPSTSFCIVSSFCQRGSLHNFLERSHHFDAMQSSSLAMDFLTGMRFIHSSKIGFHGDLASNRCLIDRHFTLKISELGFWNLKSKLPWTTPKSFGTAPQKLFWTAPEILRGQATASRITDVYSVGVLLYQILTSSLPYTDVVSSGSTGILLKLKQGECPPFRPDTGGTSLTAIPMNLKEIITSCWEESPQRRPTTQLIWSVVSSLPGFKRSGTGLISSILTRLDGYAATLETEVQIRTEALIDERQKCDELLCEMLPRTIVTKLRSSELVHPEMFESLTIMFGDLVGFNDVASKMTPLEVTTLLNSLYSLFDPVLGHFDVYKVETIGNVYMVSSGVPVRNGNRHVKEICSVTLALHSIYLKASTTPDICFRAGIHSGPGAAGVMGTRNPRYCLFGDTVNTASRMGSHSLPNKIHLSSATAKLLHDNFGSFEVTERGQMEIKGKGLQTTFWLEREADHN